MEFIDVAIVGAGVVGLAIASEISKKGREVYVFEKNPSFGMETSERNSETIHGGLYYGKDSLKGRFCIEGKNMLYEICPKYGIPHKKVGKLTVITDLRDLPLLEKMLERGNSVGAEGLEIIEGKRAMELEPSIQALAALWSPATGMVSAHSLMKYLISSARDKCGGVDPVVYNTEVVGIDRIAGGYRIAVKDKTRKIDYICSKVVINSAGLFSDRIAEMAGINVDEAGYRLHFCKGEYFAVSGRHKGKMRKMVYPVPRGGECVHPTMDFEGGLKIGPNSVYMPKNKIDYGVDENNKKFFFDSVKEFMPFLELEDLSPDQAGIRPKLSGPSELGRDFVINEESGRGLPGLINLIGIESPGLTASLAIGNYVSKLVEEIGF